MLRTTLAPLPVTLLLTAPAAFGADAPATPAPASAPATEGKKAEDKTSDKAPTPAKRETLKEVTVEAQGDAPQISSPKYVKPLADTPQTATVVSKEVMQQQGATNLAQILKNSAGISMQAGEGGAPNGDNLTIRGFAATSDLFINGVRDFGSYSRDPFNIEQVEVVKGPNSANAGRGSTGGSVNLVTKTPKAETFYAGSIAAGTDNFRRLTLDVNQSLDGSQSRWGKDDGIDGAAFRLNVVGHMDDAPGRDVVENRRMGVAPSLTFGLGSPTQVTFEYFHLEQENIPDYGLPFVPTSNANANPGTLGGSAERVAPVSYDNFYGLKARDYEDVSTDVASIVLSHDFADGISLNNRLQYGRTTRDQVVTPPRFATATGTAIRRTDVKTRDQVNDIFTNQTNLLLKADLGGVKNTISAGIEAAYETANNKSRAESNAAGVPTTDVFNPDPNQPYNSRMVYDGGKAEWAATTLGAYLFDTVDFDEQWSWMGGARFDRFDTDYENTGIGAVSGVRTALGETFDLLSWRTALTFKPAENGAIYAAYGTSYNTSTDALSQIPFTSAAQIATARSTIQLDPEKNSTLEIGTKWNLAHQRLLLSAAVFRTDKTDARSADPTDPTNVQLIGEQRVQGVELGATGRITKEWSVIAGYCWLDSEVRKSGNPAEIGAELGNTPKHTASLWTTYDFNFGLTLGAGATHVSDRFNTSLTPSAGASSRREVDGYVTFDAMAAYRLNSHWNLQLNVYNLADERYIGTVGGGHAIPGAGRSGVLSASFLY